MYTTVSGITIDCQFFSEVYLLFSCLIFCGLARGPPGAQWPRFIEPPEPPVATPLLTKLIKVISYRYLIGLRATFVFLPARHITKFVTMHCASPKIGVASYGALGHVPLDFQLFNFSCHIRAAQTLTLGSMGLPIPRTNMLAYSCVTVYCMNFIMFLCVTLRA